MRLYTLGAGVIGAAVAFAAGCASGSGHGLELEEAQRLYASYSGSWVLNEADSEDPQQKVQQMMASRRGGRGSSGGFGGGGAGSDGPPSSGGRGGGGRGGPSGTGAGARAEGGGMNPEAMRDALSPPDRLTLSLADSTVVFEADGRPAVRLAMDGEELKQQRGEVDVKTRVRWEDGLMGIRREVEDGISTTDLFEANPDRARLIITRTVEMPFGDDIEIQLVYDREGTTEGGDR